MAGSDSGGLRFLSREFKWKILAVRIASGESDNKYSSMSAARTLNLVSGQYPPGQYPPGQYPPDDIPPDNIPPDNIPPDNIPPDFFF